MKKITLLLTMSALMFAVTLQAQVAINQNGDDADPSSVLDVKDASNNTVFYIEAATGNVAVHNTTPAAADVFSSYATGSNWAINGYGVNAPAVLGITSGTGDGIYGDVDNNDAIAVIGLNHADATLATVATAVAGAAGTASDNATHIVLLRNQQTGISGTGNGSGGVGVFGFVYGGSTSNEDAAAYFEIDYNEDLTDYDGAYARIAGYTNDAYYVGYGGHYGGFFSGNQTDYDWAYVGINTYGPGWGGDAWRNYKIIGPGSVSTIVKDDKNVGRAMFCPEAPEILFEDYGNAQLVNGEARVSIDPLFSRNIYVDSKHPLRVFIQLEGDCNGVYVTEKSASGFTVKELQKGASNVPFSWHIVATRADDYDDKGNIVSNNVNARFPIAPKKLEPIKTEKRKSALKESTK